MNRIQYLALAAAALLLWFIVSQVNHYIAGFHLYVFAGGLFVTYAGLTFSRLGGAGLAVTAGLLHDAASPVPFGTHAFLFVAAQQLIVNIRTRIPKGETTFEVVVALVANLAVFTAFSLWQIDHAPNAAATWLRLFADLLASQVFVLLVSPWFLAIQDHLLRIASPGLRAPRGRVM